MDRQEKLTRHNINLYEGDMETLQANLPPRVASVVIRSLVRNYILKKWPDGRQEINVEVEL